jgi:hypothetical protein
LSVTSTASSAMTSSRLDRASSARIRKMSHPELLTVSTTDYKKYPLSRSRSSEAACTGSGSEKAEMTEVRPELQYYILLWSKCLEAGAWDLNNYRSFKETHSSTNCNYYSSSALFIGWKITHTKWVCLFVCSCFFLCFFLSEVRYYSGMMHQSYW